MSDGGERAEAVGGADAATRFRVTLFRHKGDKSGEAHDVDGAGMCATIVTGRARDKDFLPMLKLAKFDGGGTAEKNIVAIHGVELDYDGERVPFEEAVAIARRENLRAILYTTPSHTDATPRWRCLLPTSRELPPAEHRGLVARANGAFGGIFADESFTLAQRYYFGRVGAAWPKAESVDGASIDARDDLDARAIDKTGNSAKARAADRARGDITGPIEDVVEALALIPNDARSWLRWNKFGMAAFAAAAGSEEGFEAWRAWSSKCESCHEDAACREKWSHFKRSPPTDVGYGTLLYWASRADPDWSKPSERGSGKKKRKTQADVLVEIASAASLFHTADGVAYADVEVAGHRETWPVKSKAFRDWIAREYFDKTKSPAGGKAIDPAVALVEARARFDAPERAVHLRVAQHEGKIYLDLCDDRWRAVEVDAAGWRVIDRPPVRFRRAKGMLALPTPERGGTVEELRSFINADGDAFTLAVGWVVGALSGRGPYPILVIGGEQGAAKSTFSAMLRALVDPNKVPLRGLLRHDEDLYIAANNAHVIAFDNVSKLADWLSDTLCRLATGGGFSVRELYTNTDEVLFDGSRPAILNGIENFIERPDLADRVIILTLQKIEEDKRRPEAEIWAAFEAARPRIVGALVDALSRGLRDLSTTKLDALPRMADFALWVAACEPALWPDGVGAFERAYRENRATGQRDMLDTDAIAAAVISFAENGCPSLDERGDPVAPDGPWRGTAKELLTLLRGHTDEDALRDKRWPRTPRALSGRLRRLAPALRQAGVIIEFEDHKVHGVSHIAIDARGRETSMDASGKAPQTEFSF